jgi:hypothetical protein
MVNKKKLSGGGVYGKALIKKVMGGVNDITPGILANISLK